MPGVAQVVPISVCHSDEGLNGVNILLLHLCNAGASSEQCKPSQGLNIRITLQLHTHKNTQVKSPVEIKRYKYLWQ